MSRVPAPLYSPPLPRLTDCCCRRRRSSRSKVLDSMYDVHSGINMSSHVEQGSTYSNCFSGG